MRYLMLLAVSAMVTAAYLFWQTPTELDPKSFRKAIQETAGALLVDVRTPNEFSHGHIPGAMNIDWYSPAFAWRIAELDTAKPVFLYCKAGGRSSEAAVYIRSRGFGSVTELSGGWTAWNAEALPVTPLELLPPDEMTLAEFNRLLSLEHDVLVDFYIPWNPICRKLEPTIDDLAMDYAGNIKILRVNIDTYKQLATELGLEDVPMLQFYENGNLTFEWKGVTQRSVIEQQLSTYTNQAVVDGL